jgi:hypothetical protein
MNWDSVSKLVPAVVTTLLAVLTYLGTYKYVIEPWLVARQLRKKYATALWIACQELQLHLKHIQERVSIKKASTIAALKKIPNNDFKGRSDWFTKDGYYTTVTAYKIAVVSAWLRVYQQELLFSTYRESRAFVFSLYQKADQIKTAFSKDTCLWYDYFDAIGDKLVERSGDVVRPLAFSAFCDKCFSDEQYRLFYEQLHMFIWFIADGKYLENLDKISGTLLNLRSFLKQENLLSGFEIDRPPINPELSPPVERPQ